MTGVGSEAKADERTSGATTADDLAVENGDYGKIGEHVASVLESARTAAAKIREDAREDARRVGERAQKEASDMLERSRRETADAAAKAERVQAEADAASAEKVKNADGYAAESRAAAERQAAAIISRAQDEARASTRDAELRSARLDDHVKRAEERLTQVVTGLRDIANKLEGLIAPAAGTATDADRPASGLDESLRRAAATRGVADTKE